MSWILGIDTSSAELSIGLMHEGRPSLSCSRYVPNSHAEHITRAMDYILDSSKITSADISHAGIAVGPGSFTGLRIGISFLKGFFLTYNTPVLPISSLESLAESFDQSDGTIIPVMDARRERVFCAGFKRENGRLTRLTDDQIMSLKSFSIFYKKHDTIIIDTLGQTKSSLFSSLDGWGIIHKVNDIPLQRGLACARIASNAVNNHSIWKDSVDIEPNYMQAPYAEIKRSMPAKKS